MGGPSAEPFGDERDLPQKTRRITKLAQPWWNLGETLVEPPTEPFGNPRWTSWQPKTDLPQRVRDITKLGEPWWNLLAAQDGLGSENQGHSENWRNMANLGGTWGKPWQKLGGTFRETFWQPKTDLPQRTRNATKLGETLAEPWWNLPRNFLAALDGSAPENHNESETYSAPKPLVWLKTPKLLLLLGKNGIKWAEKDYMIPNAPDQAPETLFGLLWFCDCFAFGLKNGLH